MTLPAGLRRSLENQWREHFGHDAQVGDFRRCGGGCINEAGFLNFGEKPAFVKFNSGVPGDFFSTEAAGLQALRDTESIRVPEVYFFGPESPEHPAYLVLEALESGAETAQSATLFGEDLAALHHVKQSQFGFSSDNYIGATKQINSPRDNWIEFFRDCRLRPQFDWICQENNVSSGFKKQFETLLSRLDKILIPGEGPSLLHGDLWGGNSKTVAGGKTAIFDPAVYCGHREADLAMTELFGSLPAAFYDAYQSHFPLEPGYDERRDLYNLYHMLNHWKLFGGSYRGSCERIVRSYL